MHLTANRISLLLAAALATVVAFSPTSRAATSDECAAYATGVANDHHRGLVGNVVTLPLDVTGALLTGRTTHDAERDRVFDQAFAECISDEDVVLVVPREDDLDD